MKADATLLIFVSQILILSTIRALDKTGRAQMQILEEINGWLGDLSEQAESIRKTKASN